MALKVQLVVKAQIEHTIRQGSLTLLTLQVDPGADDFESQARKLEEASLI